jgi:hypothetical protein
MLLGSTDLAARERLSEVEKRLARFPAGVRVELRHCRVPLNILLKFEHGSY